MPTGFLEAVGTLSAGIEIRRLESKGRTEAAARDLRDPVPPIVRPLFNPTEGYASYVVPAVLVLILQQTLLIGIGLLGGTAAEMPSADPSGPGRRRSLGVTTRLLGRALDLGLFALPFLLACIFLALALSSLFRRREAAMQVLLFTSLPSAFLAGFLRLTEMGAALRHVRLEWLVLWALAALYFALAWLAAPRVEACERGADAGV